MRTSRGFTKSTKVLTHSLDATPNGSRLILHLFLQIKRLKILKSQFATSSSGLNRLQIATGLTHGGRRKLPVVFTEHGAIMAANVLNSPQAVKMSVFVVRAFVLMRRELISRLELEKRLLKVENILLAHDHHIRNLYEKIRPLLLPPPKPEPQPPKKRIGFLLKERRVPFKSSKRSKLEMRR